MAASNIPGVLSVTVRSYLMGGVNGHFQADQPFPGQRSPLLCWVHDRRLIHSSGHRVLVISTRYMRCAGETGMTSTWPTFRPTLLMNQPKASIRFT